MLGTYKIGSSIADCWLIGKLKGNYAMTLDPLWENTVPNIVGGSNGLNAALHDKIVTTVARIGYHCSGFMHLIPDSYDYR